jgi:hypothetical protein
MTEYTKPHPDRRPLAPVIVLRVAQPMLAKIDAFGRDRCVSRSEAVRRLVSAQLDAIAIEEP